MLKEEYTRDVLQNIEAKGDQWRPYLVIDPGRVVDRDVLAAVDALIKVYTREKSGHRVQSPGPPGRAGTVYQHCRRICEWRLGKQPLNEGEPLEDDPRPGELSVSEIILCLKRIRKSIRLWHAQAGPQGYLKYVRQFLADGADQIGV